MNELLLESIYPFWLNDVMINESIMLVKGEGNPKGKLRFHPKRIISVKDSMLETEYRQNRDWVYQDNSIIMLDGSNMPFISEEILYAKNLPEGLGTQLAINKIDKVLYSDSPFIISHQIAVTYEYDKNDWVFNNQTYSEIKLSNTIEKLKTQKKLQILLYGDSISVGANSSKLMNIPPYLPTWIEQVQFGLRYYYKTEVEVINKSESGQNSIWAVDNMADRLSDLGPDLMILAFGMNDGSQNVEEKIFVENLKAIMNYIKKPDCEFIIVTPMLANPESEFVGKQLAYVPFVRSLERDGVAVIDMGNFHKELLINKRYQDFTGNNINHPNDFLARCYAMNILSLLIKFNGGIGIQ